MAPTSTPVQYIDGDGYPRAAIVTHNHGDDVVNLVVFNDSTLDGKEPSPVRHFMSVGKGNDIGHWRWATLAPVDTQPDSPAPETQPEADEPTGESAPEGEEPEDTETKEPVDDAG